MSEFTARLMIFFWFSLCLELIPVAGEASPATGISSRHNENQKNIINLAVNSDKKEIYKKKDGVSLVKFKLPIE